MQLAQLQNCIKKFLATCVLFVHLLGANEATNYFHVFQTAAQFPQLLVYIPKHLHSYIKFQNILLNFSNLYHSKLRKFCNHTKQLTYQLSGKKKIK
jgi:hypothetical protein